MRQQASTFAAGVRPNALFVDQASGNLFTADVTAAAANVVLIFGPEGGAPVGGIPAQLHAAPSGAPQEFDFGGEPAAVAVDERPLAGYVYVDDTLHNVVDKFEITPAKEYKYVCELTGYGGGCTASGGSPTQAFEEPIGVAVDSEGNVYVSDFGHSLIDEFNAAGGNVEQIKGSVKLPIGHPEGLAFDAQGDLYVQRYFGAGTQGVLKLAANLLGLIEPEETPVVLDARKAFAVAVNRLTGHVFVDRGSTIAEYEAAGGPPAGEFWSGGGSEGVAASEADDSVYVADPSNHEIVHFGASVALPTVETGEATSVLDTTATLEGTVNPEGEPATWYFEYGPTTQYGSKTPTESAGEGNAPQPLTAPISGLTPGATYQYRLVATNSHGVQPGENRQFTAALPPSIDGESTASVTATAATFQAQVNPNGHPTTYRFEYGPTASYGTATPEGSAGSGVGDETVTVPLTGLTPGATYHFRVIATSPIGAPAIGADYVFTTATGLPFAPPENRAYELVSPTQSSDGGGVFPLSELTHSQEGPGRPLQSAANGTSIAYLGEDFYEPVLGSLNEYLSTRGPDGWATRNLTPAVPSARETKVEAILDVAFSQDLSARVFESNSAGRPAVDPLPGGYANLYVEREARGEALVTATPPNRTPETFGTAEPFHQGGAKIERKLAFAGGNAGTPGVGAFTHLIFTANDALTPNAFDGGALQDNLYEWVAGSLRLVNVLPNGEADPNASFGVNNGDEYVDVPVANLEHAISADGTRIFWTDQNNGNLYVRENGETTKQVDSAVGGGGQFQTASADGSKVFFTKAGHLYEYEPAREATTDLTPGGEVLGLVGASDDGTYIYFVAESVLENGATAGRPNLYLNHGGKTTFVATLSPNDNVGLDLYGSTPTYGDWYQTFAGRTARVSPNGTYVAFTSILPLTGYNNLDVTGERRDQEAFVYDATTHALDCASCNTAGTQPTSLTLLPPPINGTYQQRYLTNEGRLFFSTADPVVPEDTNGKSDVYEYQNGHVHLISPGNAGDEAVFADASETGEDVFFTTRQQLVPGDHNQTVDLYDARVGGRSEEVPAPLCSEGACHEVNAASPPSFSAPLSSASVGPGNPPPAPPTVKSEPKGHQVQTRAQKLREALRACRGKRDRHRRALCEAQARRRYGSKANKSTRHGRRR